MTTIGLRRCCQILTVFAAVAVGGCARSALSDPNTIDENASMWRKLRPTTAGGTSFAGTEERSRDIERNLGVF